MSKYVALVFVIFFISCQQKNEKIINSIEVLYYNGIFERVISVACDEIVYIPLKKNALIAEFTEDGDFVIKPCVILDTILTDKKILQEILNELKFTKNTKDYGVDARMKCYINFTDNSIDSLCLGAPPTYGYYNGKSMRFTNKFAYLLRKNCGFYKWIGVDQMQYFDELNDSTFVREKVISRWGKEY